MKSILDVKVSCFANYFVVNDPVNISLLAWLKSKKYRNKVIQIRNERDRKNQSKLKSLLPAITPSGTFSIREEKGLVCHNRLIQFDIDFKDNKHIGNFYQLKGQISNIENVAYCGLSVSGNGYWGLIPITHPEKHKKHFDDIKYFFGHFNIVLDEKPKNVASLRGYSWDDEPYFNHSAKPFSLTNRLSPQKHSIKCISNVTSDRIKVDACIEHIVDKELDLTDSYDAWFKIGCSLANTFGEDGRGFFHSVSQFHPHYTPGETDKQFTRCLKGWHGYTIATFLGYCAKKGIKYKK